MGRKCFAEKKTTIKDSNLKESKKVKSNIIELDTFKKVHFNLKESEKVKSNIIELDTFKNVQGKLEVSRYEEVINQVGYFLDERPVFELTSEEDHKRAKEVRAEINKVLGLIKRRRIDAVADFVGLYEEQCKTIERCLDKRQKEFGAAISDYEEKVKSEDVVASATAKIYTATLTFTDEKLIKKISDFAEKNNCELNIK